MIYMSEDVAIKIIIIVLQHNVATLVLWTRLFTKVGRIEPTTRMWANAQPDGRPAEHRWRPLFNAAKFGWRPLLDVVQ